SRRLAPDKPASRVDHAPGERRYVRGSAAVLIGIAHDPIYRIRKRFHTRVGRERRSALPVLLVNVNRAATGGSPGVHVSPTVSHQKRAGQVYAVPRLRLQQQSGERLAAGAAIPV